MDFKEMMIQYLFYYNHTVCGSIDIEVYVNSKGTPYMRMCK